MKNSLKAVFAFILIAAASIVFAQPIRPGASVTQIDNVTTNSMDLHWVDKSNNETSFYIYWDAGLGGGYSFLTSVVSTTVASINTTYNYSVTGLNPNTFYSFRVYSHNASGNSTTSAPGYVAMGNTTIDVPPADPSVCQVILNAATSQQVSWTDNSANEEGFEVYISTDNFATTNSLAGTTSYDVNFLDVTGLNTVTQYWYRVRAFNTGGTQFSNYTNIANQTTLDTLPESPTAGTITNVTISGMRFGWTDNANNETGFHVFISTDGSSFSPWGDASVDELYLDVTGLTPSTHYWFRVWAFNGVGNSLAYASSDMITDGLLPVEMTSFTANAGEGYVDLAWHTESETNNASFRIYRSTVIGEIGEQITAVPGALNSPVAHNYRFRDSRVTNGTTYYYRISDIDLDGREAVHTNIVNATPTQTQHNVAIIGRYGLAQNYPNPFNPTTDIFYSVGTEGAVKLTVQNVLGQTIAVLVDRNQSQGRHNVQFDASNLPAGNYFYTLQTPGFTSTKKMTLTK